MLGARRRPLRANATAGYLILSPAMFLYGTRSLVGSPVRSSWCVGSLTKRPHVVVGAWASKDPRLCKIMMKSPRGPPSTVPRARPNTGPRAGPRAGPMAGPCPTRHSNLPVTSMGASLPRAASGSPIYLISDSCGLAIVGEGSVGCSQTRRKRTPAMEEGPGIPSAGTSREHVLPLQDRHRWAPPRAALVRSGNGGPAVACIALNRMRELGWPRLVKVAG